MSKPPVADAYPGLDCPWSASFEDVLDALCVDPAKGRRTGEIGSLRARYGWNQLRAIAPRRLWAIGADQFRNIVVLLLVAAGVLAVLFDERIEGMAIFAVILINGAIGFLTEWRATRSMESLRRLGQVDTVVVRDGTSRKINADQILPGDIVLLQGGDIISADIRLIEAANLQADESALTGESLPVDKSAGTLPKNTPVTQRSNMVFKGTALTRGSGRGVVVGIGQQTELGRISSLVSAAKAQQTPLEKRLDALGERLAWIVIVVASAVALGGIVAGRELFLAIEVAIALAVAAIPEGLPIVATIALARGMWRMARKNAVISRLSAVETLGATTVILTDKTGTLTENRMAVVAARIGRTDFARHEGELKAERVDEAGNTAERLLDEALSTAALCANASVRMGPEGGVDAVGDPTEVALLSAAYERNIEREKLLNRLPELSELAFDTNLKLMATLHEDDGRVMSAVKGAPESIIHLAVAERTAKGDRPLDARTRQEWLEQAIRLGARGLRTIAVAKKHLDDISEDPCRDLVLLGVFGLEDPPRAGVGDALKRCRDAGVSVVMVTGDHAATACNVASEIGMLHDTKHGPSCIDGPDFDAWLEGAGSDRLDQTVVFSRVTPEQKLRLISRFQDAGNIVAMTGDGVNDAPALKKADIGVAMGIRGTAVAREAAAMVLRDDEFGTIAEAIAQGRAIYENIRKFAVYLLSCNISEVLVVTLATIAGAPLPLLPLQILFLNLVTDVFPALALGVGEGAPDLMKKPPRPAKEQLLTRTHWLRIAAHGAVISITVLTAMSIAVHYLAFDSDRAVTVSFCTLAFAQLWHVFNMRDDIRHLFRNEVVRNIWVWAAVALCTGLITVAIYHPLLSGVLALRDPGPAGWAVILPLSLVPLLIAPLIRRAAQSVSASS